MITGDYIGRGCLKRPNNDDIIRERSLSGLVNHDLT